MKRLTLVMIIVWSVIALLILGAMIRGIASGGISSFALFSGDYSGNRELLFDETYPAEALKTIELSLSSDDATIYLTDDDTVKIQQYVIDMPQDRKIRVTASGNALRVESGRERGGINFFSFRRESRVDIYLPKSYREALLVSLLSGTIRIDGELNLSELQLKLSSGDIRSGAAINAKNADIEVTSGTIDLTGGLLAERYDIGTSSGTVRVYEQLTGSGSIKVTSGTIDLAGVDIADSLDVRVSSGDVALSLAGNPALNFTGEVTSGDIDTYFDLLYHDKIGKKISAETGAEPRKKLNVKVTSGTVRILEE